MFLSKSYSSVSCESIFFNKALYFFTWISAKIKFRIYAIQKPSSTLIKISVIKDDVSWIFMALKIRVSRIVNTIENFIERLK